MAGVIILVAVAVYLELGCRIIRIGETVALIEGQINRHANVPREEGLKWEQDERDHRKKKRWGTARSVIVP